MPMPKSLRRRQVVSDGPVRGPGGSRFRSERVELDDVLGSIVDWHKDRGWTVRVRSFRSQAANRSDQNTFLSPLEKTTSET